MPDYAKFMLYMVTKKLSLRFEDNDKMKHCSAIPTSSLMENNEYPYAVMIPCTIRLLHFSNVVCDVEARINLMPLSIYKKLGLGDPKPTMMRLLMVNRTF